MNNKIKTFCTADLASVLPKEYLLESITDMFHSGLPHGLDTGVDSLDSLFRLDTGRLCVITGIPNDGKSEFVDFLVSSYNKKYGYKTIFFSPENQPIQFHMSKLISKYTNKHFDKSRLSEQEMHDTASYIADNYFFFNYEKVSTASQILEESYRLIQQSDAKILVIDAFNKLECEKSGEEDSLIFISKLLDRLCSFAIKNDVLVFLVAHPRKMDWGKDSKRMPSPYDINGSANFFNKSDFVISVQRRREDKEDTSVYVEVGKVKFNNYGSQGKVLLQYDKESGNYYDGGSDSWDDYDDLPKAYAPAQFSIPSVSVKSPLDVEVSLYQGATDNIGTTVNLRDFLFSDKYRTIAEDIRAGKTPQERKERKAKYKRELPCATISGKFSQRGVKYLEAYSGYLSIDIDFADNKEVIEQVPNILKSLDYISYFGKSISGDGYFAICKISNPTLFKQHFLALEQDFKQLGIKIDTSCSDISRLRFASYDTEAYENPNATTYMKVFEEPVRKQVEPKRQFVSNSTYPATTSSERVEKHIQILKQNGLSLPDDYHTWFNVAMSLSAEFGEAGREYFHSISSLTPKYDSCQCDLQYDRALGYSSNNFSLGTLMQLFKDTERNISLK